MHVETHLARYSAQVMQKVGIAYKSWFNVLNKLYLHSAVNYNNDGLHLKNVLANLMNRAQTIQEKQWLLNLYFITSTQST